MNEELKIEFDKYDFSFKENISEESTNLFNSKFEFEDEYKIKNIIFSENAKKSHYFPKLMFSNKIENIDHKKNEYLKVIHNLTKEYYKNKEKFINKIYESLENEKNDLTLARIKGNYRIDKISEKLEIENISNFYHFKTNLKYPFLEKQLNIINNIRWIVDLKGEELIIHVIDLYHLFTITNSKKYKPNFIEIMDYKEDLKKFFEIVDRKTKNWKRKST